MTSRHRLSTVTLIVAFATSLALLVSGTALGALVSGTLPAAGFTYTANAINEVNMAGTGVHLKAKDAVNVKTTYSRVAPSTTFQAGWHYHNGPVIVTVTTGTLTFFDATCGTWDVSAGQTYIETTGQILNAKVLPARNSGIVTVEWFTTRLYPQDLADVVEVAAPCVI